MLCNFGQYNCLSRIVYFCRTGGKISVPQNSTENASVADLASKYFDACDANSQSGKTVWIGIDKQQDGKWKVTCVKAKYSTTFNL